MKNDNGFLLLFPAWISICKNPNSKVLEGDARLLCGLSQKKSIKRLRRFGIFVLFHIKYTKTQLRTGIA